MTHPTPRPAALPTGGPTPAARPPGGSAPRAPLRAFYGLVVAVCLVLGGGTALATRVADQIDLAPDAMEPAPGQSLSTRPELRLRYRRPLAPASLEDRVRLEPAVPLAWETRGSHLVVRPEADLVPDAAYTLVLAPGLADVAGRATRAEQRFPYRTRAPRLLALAPAIGERGLVTSNLWSVPLDGGAPRQLTADASGVAYASVAPDGEGIVYTTLAARDSADQAALWWIDRDGGGRRRLGPQGLAAASAVAWSPRGDLIVYERRALTASLGGLWQVGPSKLWGVKPDGTDLGPIYGRGDQQGQAPTWAPDGQRLALYEAGAGTLTVYNFTRAVVSLPLTQPSSATWAPDGRRFAYVDLPDPTDARQAAIYLASIDDPTPRRLTPDGPSDFHPTWRPDGPDASDPASRSAGGDLAVVRRAPDGTQGVWLLAPDNGTATLLQAEPGWLYDRPLWAPSGETLYWSRRASSLAADASEVWASSPTAPTPRRLGSGQVVGWLP